MPCAPAITAVLMPMTSPREETSGPPELPGLRAASVWITSSISRPDTLRSERPSADTTPAVTVDSKPSGLPIATTTWPRLRRALSPSTADGVPAGRPVASRARAVAGSLPSPRAPAGARAPSTPMSRLVRTRERLGDFPDQAVEADGLGVEVVGACRERAFAVAGHGMGGQRDDRDGPGFFVRLELPDGLPAVDHRQV